MATASTINIGSQGATIQWTSTSDPTPPTLTLSKGSESWMTISGSKITVSANNGAQRSASVSATSTTTANTAYNGTATVTSGYTIQQSGGTTYTVKLYFRERPTTYNTGSTSSDGDIMYYIQFDEGDKIPAYYQWTSGSVVRAERSEDSMVISSANFDDFKNLVRIWIGPTQQQMMNWGFKVINVDLYTHEMTTPTYVGPILGYGIDGTSNVQMGYLNLQMLMTDSAKKGDNYWEIDVALIDLYN